MDENLSVLVVDDEDHIRKLLTIILKKAGFKIVIEAKNGEEAVVHFKRYHPQITLMDINMPVMNGQEALEHIMTVYPEALVVMLTSMATRDAVEKCAALGAIDYLRKDSLPEEIEQTICNLKEEYIDEKSLI